MGVATLTLSACMHTSYVRLDPSARSAPCLRAADERTQFPRKLKGGRSTPTVVSAEATAAEQGGRYPQ